MGKRNIYKVTIEDSGKGDNVLTKRFLKIMVGLFLGIAPAILNAQQEKADSSSVLQKIQDSKAVTIDGKKIEIIQSVQLWDVHTLNALGIQEGEKRNDLYIRRGQIGVKGSLQQNVAFRLVFAYDGIGKNKNTASRGKPNANNNREFFLFEALTMWRYQPLLNITAGYFRPQVGREQMSAPFKISSFEYSLSNFQPRAHYVDRGSGRELGVNAGGLHIGEGWSFNYNFGLFDISSEKLMGNGSKWYPMMASRVAFSIGDPEMEKYGIGYRQSYYGKRKGITFGINGTYQGTTEVMKSNSFYGGDVLANWGAWDFMVEYDWLYRRSVLEQPNTDLELFSTKATTDLVCTYKLTYNFLLKNGRIIQAATMYSGQQASDWGETQGLNSLTGATDQEVYDIGLNYLLNKDNLKFSVHYVWGERVDAMPDHRYAYLGSGFQYLF